MAVAQTRTPLAQRYREGCLKLLLLCLFSASGCAVLAVLPINPAMFVVVLGIWMLAIMIIASRLVRRRHAQAIRAFQERIEADQQEFLRDVGVDPSSGAAAKALGMRARLADLGRVPPESLRASDRLQGELVELPFYDSPDSLELVFILEDELGIKIADDDFHKVLAKPWDELTVGEVILAGVRLFEQHCAARQEPP